MIQCTSLRRAHRSRDRSSKLHPKSALPLVVLEPTEEAAHLEKELTLCKHIARTFAGTGCSITNQPMFTPTFTTQEFEKLTDSQQHIILALATKNGALENQPFDEELADISLGLFEPADTGDVLPPYFLVPTEIDGYLRAKIRLIYETAIALSNLTGSPEIIVQAEPLDHSLVVVLNPLHSNKCLLYERICSIQYQFQTLEKLADEILRIKTILVNESPTATTAETKCRKKQS